MYAALTDNSTTVLVALIAQTGLILAALLPSVLSARRHAREANQAVNCKPPDAPKLSEVIDQIAEDVRDTQSDVREVRQEQAALAMIVGEHIAEHRRG